jgi:hypothetical protein
MDVVSKKQMETVVHNMFLQKTRIYSMVTVYGLNDYWQMKKSEE